MNSLKAQISKTVDVTAGNLARILTAEERRTITDLTLTGNIDARDFMTMNYNMPELHHINLSAVSVSAIKTVQIPGVATEHQANAIPVDIFRSNHLLRSVKLPSTVTVIKQGAFYDCSALTSIDLSNSVTSIEDYAFEGCNSLTTVSIPESVISIGYSAFEQCENLSHLSIPSSVSVIKQAAFGGCRKLTTIYCYRAVPLEIEPYHFFWLDTNNCTLHVPIGSESLYAAATGWQDFPNIVGDATSLALSTYIIHYNTEGGNFNLQVSANTEWKITSNQSWLSMTPSSGNNDQIVTITAQANTGSSSRYATIKVMAEGEESQIIQVKQKSNSEVILVTAGNLQYLLSSEEMESLTSLTLTGTINAIDIETINNKFPLLTFLDLSRTTLKSCSNGYASYPDNWFPGPGIGYNSGNYGGLRKPLLSTLLLPSMVGVIGCSAFESSGITIFSIPSTVTILGRSAFAFCTSLDSIIIPFNVKELDKWVFNGCIGLKEAVIEAPLTTISEGTFAGCNSLTSFTMPSTIKSIQKSAFFNCSSLTTVQLPADVIEIENTAFFGCTGLASIYSYNATPPSIGEESFAGVNTTTCILNVPFGSAALYANAMGWKEFKNIVEMAAFDLSATEISMEAQPEAETILVNTDKQWKAASDQDWLAVSPTLGEGQTEITLRAQNNEAPVERVAIVSLSAPEAADRTVTVTQHALVTGVDNIKKPLAINCYPNPFTQEMVIEIANPTYKEVNVEIYSISGERIKSLVRAQKGANISLCWDGTDEREKQVPQGMYLLKVNEQTWKVIKR